MFDVHEAEIVIYFVMNFCFLNLSPDPPYFLTDLKLKF